MIDLLHNAKLAQACAKRREQRERQKAAPKMTKAHGAVYIRADLAPDVYKKLMNCE